MRLFAVLLLLAVAATAETAAVTVLATTDLHGYLYPVDYFTNRPAARGLARLATLIRQTPHALLIDCGDTIQGSPLEYVYQTIVRTGRAPLGLPFDPGQLPGDPMMRAMNLLRYDAMTLGNHEFNYGLRNLRQARGDARFPWLSANTTGFQPYIVKQAGPVKVAVIGVTTPNVPTWEKPENYQGHSFEPAPQAVERVLARLRADEKPDLVVVAAHGGLSPPPENFVEELAFKVAGIDAIVYGHSHQEVAERRIGEVLVTQPRNWGMSLARLDFSLAREGAGPWRVVEKRSRLLTPTPETPADEEVLRLARPYHELAERYLAMPVAELPRELSGELGRVEDTALVDAIHAVQMHYSGADVSFTALFNPRLRVPQGPITVRQIAALYVYDNELYALEGDGRMVKDALENAARFYLSCEGARCSQVPLINRRVMGYNYDMAQGVEYEIDLTRPEGDRIRNLRYQGQPLDPARKLRIAVNNYRAAGSDGYGMFRRAPIVWRSNEDLRDLMIRYYTERKKLPAETDGNWRVVPEEARRALAREAAMPASR